LRCQKSGLWRRCAGAGSQGTHVARSCFPPGFTIWCERQNDWPCPTAPAYASSVAPIEPGSTEHVCSPDRQHRHRGCNRDRGRAQNDRGTVIGPLPCQSAPILGLPGLNAYAKCLRCLRRRGRVAEGGGLLNRYTLSRRIEGSNPSVSAKMYEFFSSRHNSKWTCLDVRRRGWTF
jgi:hypothetical protein